MIFGHAAAVALMLTFTASAAFAGVKAPVDGTYVKKDGTGVVYLAGGCFWGTEKYMQSIHGVVDATSGYANGNVPNPTYKRVCEGGTNFRETVRVEYDKSKVSLQTLLYAFFRVIDPTIRERQGNDRGSQYQSGIYYVDAQSAKVVAEVVSVEKLRYRNFAVEVKPLENFYKAEEYHQNYLDKNPGGYCHIAPSEMKDASAGFIDAAKYRRPAQKDIQKKLSSEQYQVTQNAATEAPFENAFYEQKKKGIYVDIVTGEPLFSTKDQFDSGCGWPSFSSAIDDNTIVYMVDQSHGMERIEVRSRTGNSHLGHVFYGEPVPKQTRLCINSASLKFIPYEEMDKAGYGSLKKYVK